MRQYFQKDFVRQTYKQTGTQILQNDLRISDLHLPVPSLVLQNVKNAKTAFKTTLLRTDGRMDGPTDQHSGL